MTRTIAEILADAEVTADGLYIFRAKLPRAERALVVQHLAELHGIDLAPSSDPD